MPYISTKTNIEIKKDKEAVLKQKLGKAIELIPGKSENWLMLSFDDKCSMYFRGNSEEPIAFIEIKLFGNASKDSYQKLTVAITEIFSEEMGIIPDHIYIRYDETTYWGWNGSNF